MVGNSGAFVQEIKKAFAEEMKKVVSIAAPMLVVTVFQDLLQVVACIMVTHLDGLSISTVIIATLFTNATGFSILVGMAGALETLGRQAYGAKQYQKLGIYTNTAIIPLILVCVPIMILWIFTDKILILVGQDYSVAVEARKYSVWLIPNLFSYAILHSLIRYFRAQSFIEPMLFSSAVTLCFHVLLCWGLVFQLKLGTIGAALAISISSWCNVILIGLYVKHSSACAKTRAAFFKDVFLCMRKFYYFAIFSAVMVCLQWWSSIVAIFWSGQLLQNPEPETLVLSTCLLITWSLHIIPYGVGASVRTWVSNELVAGNPQVAVWAAMVLAVGEVATVSITLYGCRYILGEIFNNDKELASYMIKMVPLVCLFIVIAVLQMAFSGVARGSGWQLMGDFVNLGAYYMIGIPIAAALAFAEHFMRGKDLFIGLATGSTVGAVLLAHNKFHRLKKKTGIEGEGEDN